MLSPAHKSFFDTFGFLHLPGILSHDIAWIIDEFESVWRSRPDIVHDGSKRTMFPETFISMTPRLSMLVEDPRIVDICTTMMGAELHPGGWRWQSLCRGHRLAFGLRQPASQDHRPPAEDRLLSGFPHPRDGCAAGHPRQPPARGPVRGQARDQHLPPGPGFRHSWRGCAVRGHRVESWGSGADRSSHQACCVWWRQSTSDVHHQLVCRHQHGRGAAGPDDHTKGLLG